MRLPGTEEWSKDAIAKRIAFERNVAHGVRFLLRETARGARIAEFQRADQFLASDAIFAFGRAAELAFASDNFTLGITICSEMIDYQQAKPTPPMQFAYLATVGALLGVFRVHFSESGIKLSADSPEAFSRFQNGSFINWPSVGAVDLVKFVCLLLPAAAVSDMGYSAETFIHRGAEGVLKRSVVDEVLVSPEYNLLSHLVNQRATIGQTLGFSELEIGYSQRLAKLRLDQPYWRSIRPRGTLVDWSLLAFRTATVRAGMRRYDQVQSQEALFIEKLAKEFASYREQRSPDRS